MKKFEYTIIMLYNYNYNPESKLLPSKKQLEGVENNISVLNRYGNDGWKIRSVAHSSHTDALSIIFEREMDTQTSQS